MHYLVIDTRFGSPVHVFLDLDPRKSPGFPELGVSHVTLEAADPSGGAPVGTFGEPAIGSVGQDPWRADRFLQFPTDGAVRRAGFALIEPRFVGVNWDAYVHQFHPEGSPYPARTPRRPVRVERNDW